MPESKRRRHRRDSTGNSPPSSNSSVGDSHHLCRRHRDDRKRRHKGKSRKSEKYDNSSISSASTSSSYEERRRSKKKRRKEKKKRKDKKESRRKARCRDEESNNTADIETSHGKALEHTLTKNDEEKEVISKSHEQSQQLPVEPPAKRRNMAPMTYEQHQALQSQVREVYDPESGRMRLVRGTGEIIERIVSKADHQTINRQATMGDGASFARQVASRAARDYSKKSGGNF